MALASSTVSKPSKDSSIKEFVACAALCVAGKFAPSDSATFPLWLLSERSGQIFCLKFVPLAIDELPAILIAAACAEGRTVLRGAEELRVKESDRIESMAEGLSRLGVANTVYGDGIEVIGGMLSGGTIDTYYDHRIAMSFSMAALKASGQIKIMDCGHVATSFPGFATLANKAGLNLKVLDL